MPDSNATDRIGINAVESAFLGMGWIFREQSVSDYGIDAHAEPKIGERPTGQLIALQVKSGASYFRERGEDFVYYGRRRHLDYWRNHCLPVFIILHNPETGLTLWQRVEDHLVEEGKKGRWAIEIPRNNVLDANSEGFLLRGISSDPASVRRFRLATDLTTMRDLARRAESEVIFLKVQEWINKTLNFRTSWISFDDPDADPDYTFQTWLPAHDINDLMVHYFPWLD